MTWRSAAFLFAGIVVLAALGSFLYGQPATALQPAPVVAESPAPSPAAAVFLDELHRRGIDPPRPEVAEQLGQLACHTVALGYSRQQLLDDYARSGIDPATGGALVDAALVAYCPEQG